MTPTIRRVLYAVLSAALAVLVLLGRITADQSDAVLPVVDAALNLATAVALVIAAKHVTEDSWSGLRLALYSLASGILALLGAFGLVFDSVAILGVLNQGFNVLGAVLMVTAYRKVSDVIVPDDLVPKHLEP